VIVSFCCYIKVGNKKVKNPDKKQPRFLRGFKNWPKNKKKAVFSDKNGSNPEAIKLGGLSW